MTPDDPHTTPMTPMTPAAPSTPWGQPQLYVALTEAELAFLSDRTSAQETRTRPLALKLAGALIALTSVPDVAAADAHVRALPAPTVCGLPVRYDEAT